MIKKPVILVGRDDDHTKDLNLVLEKESYRLIFSPSLSDAEVQLKKQPHRVILIDLDQTILDNHTLKELRQDFPFISLIGLSSRRFHQELEEAMRRYIDACFEKSGNYEDLLYWLKAVFEPSSQHREKK